jgi:PAS domain S-box-containing protein
MKFWFGKKGMEDGAGACEVMTIENREPEIVATRAASLLITPARSGGAAAAGGVAQRPTPGVSAYGAGVKSPVSGMVGSGVSTPAVGGISRPAEAAPVELSSGPAKPAMAGKGAAVSAQAPVNRLQAGMSGFLGVSADGPRTPRPVMTPVRMAAATAPIKLSPVSAVPAASQPAPAAVGASARPAAPAFGFRPKDTGAGAAGAASAGPKPVVTLGASPAAGPVSVAPGAPGAAVVKPQVSEAAPAADKGGSGEYDVESVIRPKTDQRALYYQLMNGLYDAVLILDDQGHIVDCNTRVTAMLGYSREDTWDIPIEKIITGMSNQMFEHLKRNLAENHHILIDARCFRQDGSSFAGEVGVSTLSLTRGSNIVFAIRNVDRRKSAMDEMRKGQSALEVALAPAFVCDLDGFFLIVNQAMLDAFGIPDEAQSKNVRFIDLLPDAARFFLRASCGEKLRESLRIQTPNGVPVKVELALKPVQSGQTVTAVAGSILQA